ncbi:MAG UNVERIFIED_CONTAM: hypothetical protein LVR18_03675 [Planctomycetaceae bacterium]|jgi:flagellar hook assembly protein FlgD
MKSLMDFTTSQGGLIAAEASAKAAYRQEEAAKIQTASTLPGKKISINNSVKNFNGENGVKYSFNILGKNLPKEALISGNVIVKNAEGKPVYRTVLKNLKLGENEFIWDGKDNNGKKLDIGDYKIEVTTSYNIAGVKTLPISLGVSIATEGIVERVGKDGLLLLTDGRQVKLEDLDSTIYNPKKDKTESVSSKISDYTNYLGKTVVISQDNVKYTGSNNTKIPFYFEEEGVKDAKVQISFSKDGQFVCLAENTMDIKQGQNSFFWNGASTKTPQDVKLMQDGKQVFPHVTSGQYQYKVTIVTDEGTKTLTNKREILVESTERRDGNVYIISGNEEFNVTDIEKVKNSPQKPKEETSIATLQKEALTYVGRNAVVANDIAEFNGMQEVSLPFPIPIQKGTKSPASLTVTFTDFTGNTILKQVTIDQAEIDQILDTFYADYAKLTDASKATINAWISDPSRGFAGNPGDYTGLDPANIDAVKAHMVGEARAGNLQYKSLALAPVNWDGTNNNGIKVEAGKYKYSAFVTVNDSATNTQENQLYEKDISLPITSARVINRDIILTLSDGREIALEDVEAWGV